MMTMMNKQKYIFKLIFSLKIEKSNCQNKLPPKKIYNMS